mgnify:CR=1 FL=1
MAYTEFYCHKLASDLNAGSTTDNAALHTYAAGTFVRATGVFTLAGSTPTADGVAVGDWASIYTTAGATVAVFVARVTAREDVGGTITVSLTAKSGVVASVSEGAGAVTCKVGGAWLTPSFSIPFSPPFAIRLIQSTRRQDRRCRKTCKR